MTPSLLRPQGHISCPEALRVSQLAPEILKSNPRVFPSSPLGSLFAAPETGDVWTVYENLLLSCLRTGDDKAAQDCLERIVIRFGEKDERVMALSGLVQEAKATNNNDLEKILKGYEMILEANDANVVSSSCDQVDSNIVLTSTSQSRSAELPCYDQWAKSPSQLLPSTRSSNSTLPTLKPGLSCLICTSPKDFMHSRFMPWRRYWC